MDNKSSTGDRKTGTSDSKSSDSKIGTSADRQASTASVTRVRLIDESDPRPMNRKKLGEYYEACVTREAEEKAVFTFFRLPRELRDEIYKHALEFKRKFTLQNHGRVRGRNVAELSPQLVSRQFREEYLDRAERESCFVITDRDHFHGEVFKLPRPMRFTRKLELHVALACDEPDHAMDRCRAIPELRMHRKWITDLSEQMNYLDSVEINVYMDPHTMVKACEQNVIKEQYRFTSLAALTSLRVFQSGYFVGDKNPTCPWNFSNPRKLVLEYSHATGTLHEASGTNEVARKLGVSEQGTSR